MSEKYVCGPWICLQIVQIKFMTCVRERLGENGPMPLEMISSNLRTIPMNSLVF